ncbi:MAG TPA: AsmA family protein [Candidatus Acidoferrales bacterium]
MKKPLMIVGGIILLLLIILLALPLFINANQFKPTLESKLSTALGRQVTIGDIKLAIFSGGVTVSDIAIADDPKFSKSPFLTAKSLTVGVELMPLIFSKQVNVESITVDSPDVALIHGLGGKWNYSSLGGSSPSTPASSSASPGALSVKKLEIKNGKIIVSTLGSSQKPSAYQEVNLEASDLSYTSQFPFKLSAKGPGGSDLKVEGKAGPINATDSSNTPMNATVDVQHLDLATTGFIDPASGIAGVLDFKGDLGSDGKQMSSKGTIKVTKLKASAAGSPSTVPVNLDYATVYTLESQSGVLNQGDIKIGSAVQHLTGSYNLAGDPAKLNMTLKADGMPLNDLEGFLPAVGVNLPSGSKLQGGTLAVNLTITGPADKPTIAGPVNFSNTKLAGFSLKSKLGALGSFAGLGGGGGGNDTDIQTLSANIKNDPSGTNFDSLNLVLPSIGTVTGKGTVSASGQLNLKMVANLAGGLGKGMGAMTSVAGGATNGIGGAMSALTGGSARNSGGAGGSGGGIPFAITGTTSAPVVVPDVGGMVGGLAKGAIPTGMGKGGAAGAATGALGGLLGHRKP